MLHVVLLVSIVRKFLGNFLLAFTNLDQRHRRIGSLAKHSAFWRRIGEGLAEHVGLVDRDLIDAVS